MLLLPVQVSGAGGSLKVTILQSSDSRAFSTVSLTPGPRSGDSMSATPADPSTLSKQTLQFFCYICKANCSSQQVLPAGPWRVGRSRGGCPACPPHSHLWGPMSSAPGRHAPAQNIFSDQPQRQDFGVRQSWFESALSNCVDLRMRFPHVVPQFPHASDEETFRTYLVG